MPTTDRICDNLTSHNDFYSVTWLTQKNSKNHNWLGYNSSCHTTQFANNKIVWQLEYVQIRKLRSSKAVKSKVVPKITLKIILNAFLTLKPDSDPL